MLNERALERGVGREACVIRIVASDISRAIGYDTVARIRKPLPIVIGLETVLGNRKGRRSCAARSQFWRPADHWDRQHWLRAAAFALSHKTIRRCRRCGRTVIEALKIPIGGVIV